MATRPPYLAQLVRPVAFHDDGGGVVADALGCHVAVFGLVCGIVDFEGAY